ncbi:MAG: glycosyltransferase [Clostridia bacterium]|nr:glycosyltransferase [Clostridia bacterium]
MNSTALTEVIKIKKKVLFGITSLGFGGAERVLVDISNKLSEKYDVTIFSIYDHGELQKELNNSVKFKSLYRCSYKELNNIQRMWSPIRILLFARILYKKYIKDNYDVEVSFLEGPITRLFSTKNKKTKKFAWIHNDIKRVFGSGLKAKIKKAIDKKIYDRYDNLVFVSKDNRDSFKEVYTNIDENKMNVIYNYIDKDLVIKKSNILENMENINKDGFPKLVTVCRLVEQKAIDRFIKVHSKLVKEGIHNEVYIIGDGPERERLQKLIEQENVQSTFKLLGKKDNPYPYIKMADYFCLLSNYEGYGMVLEEAKILGKKVIITDTAAREAVEGYSQARILGNNENDIYSGLKEIITSDKKENIQDEYNYDNKEIIDKIINLINQ